MTEPVLQGVFTALVTPFRDGGVLDEEALDRLLARQLDAGIHGLVPCGTTGETPTLDDDEWGRVVARSVAAAAGEVPVVAGTGTNNTSQTIARTRAARELGADAALVVTPYYNKPNRSGLLAHYRAVAEEGGLPVVVYNVPSRTGFNLQPELLFEIARVDGIVAVKEASGSLVQAQTIIERRERRLALLSGEDDLTCAMTLMGGDGVISVVSNVDPAGTVRMVDAALEGDAERARSEHFRMQPLVHALFSETNPVPAKAALATLGLIADVVRPPLSAAARATRDALDAALEHAGVSR